MNNSVTHHPDCKMPACGIEGKYCPDCAGWQRQNLSKMPCPKCAWCGIEFVTEDGIAGSFKGLIHKFCCQPHLILFAESNSYEEINGRYSKEELDRSNGFQTDDALTQLFYLLLRDYLPAGYVELIVRNTESSDGKTKVLSNFCLASYADELSSRIRKVK